ncbi:MAG TPA: TnsA endonuclease N-terminal domain-containing protein [Magnetospirillum sp.]|jgi:hypothetical protein|nr:TnsA endonuclease N-terminal domain-containing protein [Magnetospirillum sp.]
MGNGRRPVAVESTLERDFALLQRFDPTVATVEEQPLRVEYFTAGGSGRFYVPDFLVTHQRPSLSTKLVEVKFSTDPALVSGALDERFAAARIFASARNWSFEVVTEQHIRTPRLGNATFLLPYRQRPANAGIRALLLMALRSGPATIEALIDVAGGDRGRTLPTIWGMVARFEIGADLDRPLTMRSPLFLPEKDHGRAV